MARNGRPFHVFLLKPSHYDSNGYPITWVRSTMPSNSLACLYGLTEDCQDRQILGPDAEFKIWAQDEANSRIHAKKLIRMAERDGGKAICCLVGVQSNQFPRAVDVAQPFLKAGIPVCVGGFHVSGCMAMLQEMPADMVEAQEMGISFFLGETEENRLDEVLIDAWNGALKPVYGSVSDLPSMEGAPVPYLPKPVIDRSMHSITSFDMGRGCPFQCSFCTIINVQGRKSRFRTSADLEKIIRHNWDMGITYFYITDDNLARNRNWEETFDTLIRLREDDGINVELAIQVDTLCHRIKGFIDKAARAGVVQIFVGLENINPANLAAAKKNQNRIGEYREMFLQWKKHPIFITCGYIVGFPFDTHETVMRDVEIIKNELPIDSIYFSHLTPLPGSEDHKKLVEEGAWLDPDMNKYDVTKRVCKHPVMSDEEWDRAVRDAQSAYYSREHMITVLKRMFGTGSNKRIFTVSRLAWHIFYSRGYFEEYKMEGGIVPMRYRTDRRPSLPLENPLIFYPKFAFDFAYGYVGLLSIYLWLYVQMKRLARDPRKHEYRDLALTPPEQIEDAELGLMTETTGAAEDAAHKKRTSEVISQAKGKVLQVERIVAS